MAVQPLAAQVGVAPACQALGVSRATFYRRQRSTPGHQQPRPTPARALCEAEREQILDVLAGPRFVDRAPAEVVATLLDEGHYLCSERTMYRILAADQPVRERRNQREHPQYIKPELVATAPNQTWSWDITKLLGPTKWTYFYLYVVLDIFSRYAVGWMVADRENSALAGRLIEETCHKQGVQPQVLTLHSDRGAPMTSKCTAQLLADLGVIAEVTLFPAGASGSGVLATISFDAVGSGTSLLDLHAVILAAPFGIPIFTAAINDATVTAVPEPGTALTLISGLIAFGGFVRRSARR